MVRSSRPLGVRNGKVVSILERTPRAFQLFSVSVVSIFLMERHRRASPLGKRAGANDVTSPRLGETVARFTDAGPGRVFESVDRSGADQTSDRAAGWPE